MHHEQFGKLSEFGYTESLHTHLEQYADPQLEPGRIIAAGRGRALVQTETDEVWADPTGTVWADMDAHDMALTTGDWVGLRRHADGSGAALVGIFPRTSALNRHAAGRATKSQVLAANMDFVFLVMGMDANFNPGRMERFTALAWSSGAQPVIILNKADLVDDPAAYVHRIEGAAPGVPVHAASAKDGTGIEYVRAYLDQGKTGLLIGSSGVGKSTILNRLAGQELRKTTAVRASDGRGRHTTSLRELFLLPDGGCLIDSPGIREVGLWTDETGLDDTFKDVAELAAQCRFNDCRHQSEPGCAVKAALADGRLDPARYESYLKLKREIAFVEARNSAKLRQEQKKRGKDLAKYARIVHERKYGRRKR